MIIKAIIIANHVVCAKDEHYAVGAAETAVNNLRHSARAMMLHGNVPKRFWHFAIAHVAYIHNVTSPSRLDKSKTIFELLFSKRTDLTQVQPYGCFATVYKNRRTLQDQSFDLLSDQGVSIGIAKHNGVIGYCVSGGSQIIVTRKTWHSIHTSTRFTRNHSPLQPFHDLTQAAAQGSLQQVIPATKQPEAQEYASSESDIDDSLRSETQKINDNAGTECRIR